MDIFKTENNVFRLLKLHVGFAYDVQPFDKQLLTTPLRMEVMQNNILMILFPKLCDL